MAVAEFTYTGDPSVSDTDAVRFFTGDTVLETAELDDREIAYMLTLQSNTRLAAAMCLDVLAARYSRKADFSVGEISKSLGSRASELRKRAVELRNEVGKTALPFMGGLTHSGKEQLDEQTDDVQPKFRIGQFDNPMAHQFDDDQPEPGFPMR